MVAIGRLASVTSNQAQKLGPWELSSAGVPDEVRAYRRILCVGDGERPITPALETALRLAALFGADLYSVLVREMPIAMLTIEDVRAERRRAARRFEYLASIAAQRADTCNVRFHSAAFLGRPISQILDFVETHEIDLVVLGHLSSSPVVALFLGGLAGRITRAVPCHVLRVR